MVVQMENWEAGGASHDLWRLLEACWVWEWGQDCRLLSDGEILSSLVWPGHVSVGRGHEDQEEEHLGCPCSVVCRVD